MNAERRDTNFDLFQVWRQSKTNEDFRQLEHRGKLNRVDIARECGFARSVCDQNPRVRKALGELEDRLRIEGVLPEKADSSEVNLVPTQSGRNVDSERLRRLESENALLRAEVSDLKRRLGRYEVMSATLAETGRIPR
ncbi:VPA1267 family protein [Zoogloea sp. LCSB751]|uniref:VPA1267 family protein n=1 Tax=Zoogloea sp. LCSB751 TaxID=1965277 RepID=UPI0034CE5717